MTIVKLEKCEDGSHNNQTILNVTPAIFPVPNGYCLVPDDMMPLEHFPYGDLEAEEIGGIMTLTKWTAGEVPPAPEPEPPEPSEQDDINAMLIDHELRLSLLELGGDV